MVFVSCQSVFCIGLLLFGYFAMRAEGGVATGSAKAFIGGEVTLTWSHTADDGNPTAGNSIYGKDIKSVAFNMLNGDVYWASGTCHMRKAKWERSLVTTILGLTDVTFSLSDGKAICAGFSSFSYTPTAYPKTTLFQGGAVAMLMHTVSTSAVTLFIVGVTTHSIDEYDVTTALYSHWAGTGQFADTSISNVVKSSAPMSTPQGIAATTLMRFYVSCNRYVGKISGVTNLYTDILSPFGTTSRMEYAGLGHLNGMLYYGNVNAIFRVSAISGSFIIYAGLGTTHLAFSGLQSLSSDCKRKSLLVGDGNRMLEVYTTKTTSQYVAGSLSNYYNGPGPMSSTDYNLKVPWCGQIFRHEMYVCSSNNEVVTVGMDTYGSGSDLACTTMTKTGSYYIKPTAVVYVGSGSYGCETGVVASPNTMLRDVTSFQYLSNGDLLFTDVLSVRGIGASDGKLMEVVGTCQSAAGSVDSADPTKVQFKVVYGMHYYDGVVYLTDRGDHKIRSYDVNSRATTTYAGTGSTTVSMNKLRLQAAFDTPLRFARSKLRLLFSCVPTIARISLLTGMVTQVFTQTDVGFPHGIAILRGYVYFASYGYSVIRQVLLIGAQRISVYFGDPLTAGTTSTLLSNVNELLIDCTRRMMYVTQTDTSGTASNLVRGINMKTLKISTIAGSSFPCTSVNRAAGVEATLQCLTNAPVTSLIFSQKTGSGGFPVILGGANTLIFSIEHYDDPVVGQTCDVITSTKTKKIRSKTKTRSMDKILLSRTRSPTQEKGNVQSQSKTRSNDRPQTRSATKTLYTQPPATPSPSPSSTTLTTNTTTVPPGTTAPNNSTASPPPPSTTSQNTSSTQPTVPPVTVSPTPAPTGLSIPVGTPSPPVPCN
eukprot:PhF_6_TR37629/c0_g1_i2/m.55967